MIKKNLLWMIVCITCLLCSGFFCDIKNQLKELKKTRAAKIYRAQLYGSELAIIKKSTIIHEQYSQLRQQIKPYLKIEDKANLTAELLTIISETGEISGLIIDSTEPSVWRIMSGVTILNIHAIGKGSFSQFLNFINLLSRYPLPIVLTDYSLHLEDEKIAVKMLLSACYVSGQKIAASEAVKWRQSYLSQNAINLIKDPFTPLITNHEYQLMNQLKESADVLSHSVSIQQIKCIGFIKQNNNFLTLLLLPNGSTILAAKNSLIGIERAKIVNLNEQGLVVELAGRLTSLSPA